jgi:hypothetical protein
VLPDLIGYSSRQHAGTRRRDSQQLVHASLRIQFAAAADAALQVPEKITALAERQLVIDVRVE